MLGSGSDTHDLMQATHEGMHLSNCQTMALMLKGHTNAFVNKVDYNFDHLQIEIKNMAKTINRAIGSYLKSNDILFFSLLQIQALN